MREVAADVFPVKAVAQMSLDELPLSVAGIDPAVASSRAVVDWTLRPRTTAPIGLKFFRRAGVEAVGGLLLSNADQAPADEIVHPNRDAHGT